MTMPTVAAGSPAPEGATPMMAQFFDIKSHHPDALLFFRSGDFYELFFEDAVKAAQALGITLTRRGKHDGEDIPMCGVPFHAAENYLHTLIAKGFRVAICEQCETPEQAKKRGGKAVIRREVVRLVTPGTITEEALLDSGRHNYLACLAEAEGRLGLAWVDISTGDLLSREIGDARPGSGTASGLALALDRLDPGETLVPERLYRRDDLKPIWRGRGDRLTPEPDSRFDSANARRRLEGLYGVGTLDALGSFTRAEIAALGALVEYIDLTQKGRMPRLERPRREGADEAMVIDGATRRNLELVATLTGEKRGSLLDAIDRTVTAAGARLLADRLSAPLTRRAAIDARLDDVGWFKNNGDVRSGVRAVLKGAPDLARALARLSLGRGGPRDLASIRDGLGAGRAAASILTAADLPPALGENVRLLVGHDALIARLDGALAAELPLLARDGGMIAKGFDAALDEWRTIRDDSRRLIAGLQADYARETGIGSLKIRHNNVLGYYIEITQAHADKLLGAAGSKDARFIHRQTLASAARFTTVELSDLENRIRAAADKALALELEIFETLAGEVAASSAAIAALAHALASVDVASALAELAEGERYCRPEITDGLDFAVTGGRHPVVEQALLAAGETPFVPNDCDLSGDNRLWLLTGPNMAGKSTFLRQNALIAIMAQIGSFVPADRAVLGTVDRLFSRVGASDDLARGRSTFMVEMVETAAILNQAGGRALVILDEIGRGTATYDGLSIAWATLEHLHHRNRCRGLFATHYHELTALSARLERLSCRTMRVKEWQGDVIFLHEVAPGAADRSYGIHVARLAGLPEDVIARAEAVLARLEAGEKAGAAADLAGDLPLFRAGGTDRPGLASSAADAARSALGDRLRLIDPDRLTPRDALDLLYELRDLAAKDG